MSDDRLDRLIAALASTTPVLDDVTRARIAANLEAARAAPPVRLPAAHRRWRIGGAAAAAAGVALALALAWRGRAPIVAAGATTRPPVQAAQDRAGEHAAGSSTRGAERTVSELITVGSDNVTRCPCVRCGCAPSAELPEDGVLAMWKPAEFVSAGADGTAHGTVAGAAITLNGPGWVRRHGATIVAEARSLVVDRTSPGAAAVPLVVRIAGATIRLQSARFSADSAQVLVVRVERGEIGLRCADAEPERPLVANQAATCPVSTDGRAAVQAEVPPPVPATVANAVVQPPAPRSPPPAPATVANAAVQPPAPRSPPPAPIAAAPVRRASPATRPRGAAPVA
ncbi:MAG TPA: hypothetical protein VGD37_12345, partial [Kofleriaceae bacterium]